MIIELIAYLSVSLVPTALPISVLISSVMVLGNMAEQYELASLKTAGIPLLRIMRPLMFVTIGISFFSFFCSNNIIPVANLKFKSRLYDIKKQKPTLSLEEGVFNDDFKNIVIHIGKKEADNKTIRDVLIYDHNYYNNNKVSIITAQKGEMFMTDDQQYFVMNLFDGTQYQETKANNDNKKKSYPFVRTSFQEWNKYFDLEEFEIDETDTKLFRKHHSMLSSRQLKVGIDSLDRKILKRHESLHNKISRQFRPIKDEVIKQIYPERPKQAVNQKKFATPELKPQQDHSEKNPEKKITNKNSVKSKTAPKKKSNQPGIKTLKQPKPKKEVNKKKPPKRPKKEVFKQADSLSIGKYTSLIQLFKPEERGKILGKAKPMIRGLKNEAETATHVIARTKKAKVKHVYELNMKMSMALVCFIFLFIGAPMGAIIRKGGFGYPILIATSFFILFFVMNIFCKKVAESGAANAVLASWIPCLLMFPIGLILTYRAMNDMKVVDSDRFKNLFARFTKKGKSV